MIGRMCERVQISAGVLGLIGVTKLMIEIETNVITLLAFLFLINMYVLFIEDGLKGLWRRREK